MKMNEILKVSIEWPGLSQVSNPDFGRSVNPISTRGEYHAHHIATAPRIFRPSYGPAKYVAVPNTTKVDPTDHAFMTKSSSHIYFSGFLSSKTHSTVR